ncbi:hypothetical protein BH10CYA1_BH10CYA1_24910 [soil metagenome]
MHNSDQVRDFFQKMANGLVLNPSSQYEERINSVNRHSQDKPRQRVGNFSDFGVGLPPLAQS